MQKRKIKNGIMTALICGSFCIALIPLISLIWTTIADGTARLDLSFLTTTMRGVVGGKPPYGGIYHAILGTLEVTGVALLISVPLGILTAVYLTQFPPRSKREARLQKTVNFFIDVMTGIPSIVAGLFAYAVFALIFGPGSVFGLVGAVALSILMLPTIVRGTSEMLNLVPNELVEASLGLGVSKTRTTLSIVLRSAVAPIISTVLLAISRVIGETAPLLVTVGSIEGVNPNMLDGRVETLPVYIYGEYSQGLASCTADAIAQGCNVGIRYERAWAAALVLILIVLTLNILGRVVSHFFDTNRKLGKK